MKKRSKAPKLRDDALDGITNEELREALLDKLTVAELNTLTKQIRQMLEEVAAETARTAEEETRNLDLAIVLRILHDRFGWGKKRKKRLFDGFTGYFCDVQKGRMDAKEMLDCLEHQDGIKLEWKVKLCEDDKI